MVLKASGVLGERLDRAKWEVLCNDRKSCAKLTEVRGITNSKDSILMQGPVHGRRSDSTCGGVTQEWVDECELPRERTKKIGDDGGPMR
ncbi:hypothetical protein B296_00058261 [Ensete ventricosum]|uniref:Uncharacterized protein n=1 Tax=Ensete ventricosum TaxID=4639 RepID=A0A426X965_ENSVE|nr:hypothetical protein B296_00058261 [Ensete ventricosum]